jgi:poly[(R)-3-hydroxyalkanoate] polymerase subunit PhaE
MSASTGCARAKQCGKSWCSDLNPFDYMQALAQMWGRSGTDLAAAQQNLFMDMARRFAPGFVPDAGAVQPSFFNPQAFAEANAAFTKLWSSALELSQNLTRQLNQGTRRDPIVGEVLAKLFDPRAWFSNLGGMDEALQRMAEGPRLADVWDSERRTLNVFNAWAALRRRSVEHSTVMLQAWMQAAGAFAKMLNEKADRKETLSSWRDVLALWVDTANTTLLETQRSEKYLQSQREILKASTELRLAQQDLAAFCSEVFGYPTRAEIDDVHRTVTELRREVRAVQRATRVIAPTRSGSESEPSSVQS